jgi:hypothetical protein
MRIADPLKGVARIGSPWLVVYGDFMFGRMTILVRQYSRRKVEGAPRAGRAGKSQWGIWRSTCRLWRASPGASRQARVRLSARMAPAVLIPG